MTKPVNKPSRESTVSQAEFARIVGVTPAAVHQWRAKGILTACVGSKIKVEAGLVQMVTHYATALEAKESDPLRAERVRMLKNENDAREKQVVEWQAVHALHHRLYAVLVSELRNQMVYQLPAFMVGRDIHDIRLQAKIAVSRSIDAVRITLEEWTGSTGPADSEIIASLLAAFPPVIWPGKAPENLAELMGEQPVEKPTNAHARKAKS